jgi:hypothetical protein
VKDLESVVLEMGCAQSTQNWPEDWQNQKPNRRITDTAFDYRRPSNAKSKLRPPLVGPGMYGDAFQSLAIGRRTTLQEPPRPQVADPKTYKRRIDVWPEEMVRDYNSYKAACACKIDINKGYHATCQEYGGMEQLTEKQHRDMARLCGGEVDEDARRIRPSAMLHFANQLVTLRAAFRWMLFLWC